jgi:hypothetical protein
MREILSNPAATVDLNFAHVKHALAAPLYELMTPDQAEAMDELLDKVHSCGCLYTAARVMHEYSKPEERRTPPQVLLDIKTTNEKIIAQIVPAESLGPVAHS